MTQGSRTVLHGLHAACPKTQKKTSQQLCGPRRGTKNSLAATMWSAWRKNVQNHALQPREKKTSQAKSSRQNMEKSRKKLPTLLCETPRQSPAQRTDAPETSETTETSSAEPGGRPTRQVRQARRAVGRRPPNPRGPPARQARHLRHPRRAGSRPAPRTPEDPPETLRQVRQARRAVGRRPNPRGPARETSETTETVGRLALWRTLRETSETLRHPRRAGSRPAPEPQRTPLRH